MTVYPVPSARCYTEISRPSGASAASLLSAAAAAAAATAAPTRAAALIAGCELVSPRDGVRRELRRSGRRNLLHISPIVTSSGQHIPMINVSVMDVRWPYLDTMLARAG